MISVYEVVSIISSMLGIYARYLITKSFYGHYENRLKKDLILFGAYYILGNFLYLVIDIPIIMVLVNVFFLAFIAVTYEFKILKAILFAMMVYLLLSAIDALVYFLTYTDHIYSITVKAQYNSTFGVVLTNVLVYVFARVYSNLRHPRRNHMFIKSFWVSIIVVPLGTFYYMYITFQNENLSDYKIALTALIALLMAFIIFAIYEELNKYYELRENEKSLNQLNTSYQQQLVMMKQHIHHRHAMQHDFNRHVYNIGKRAESKNIDAVIAYVNDLKEDSKLFSHGIKTGNFVIDSIINYELAVIDAMEIDLQLDIDDVPDELDIKDYDLTIILSNMIRNAVEAVENVENKTIQLRIKYDNNLLYLGVKNTYDGVLIKEKDHIISKKKNELDHGYGIGNIQKVVRFYDGKCLIDYDQSNFSINAIIYTKPISTTSL